MDDVARASQRLRAEAPALRQQMDRHVRRGLRAARQLCGRDPGGRLVSESQRAIIVVLHQPQLNRTRHCDRIAKGLSGTGVHQLAARVGRRRGQRNRGQHTPQGRRGERRARQPALRGRKATGGADVQHLGRQRGPHLHEPHNLLEDAPVRPVDRPGVNSARAARLPAEHDAHAGVHPLRDLDELAQHEQRHRIERARAARDQHNERPSERGV
jgi:hypothetical protein